MKKFKAFTLIELIVAIAIFGILMAGVVRMIAPINSAAVSAKVVNNQQSVENSITQYLGENLRYATNLVIIEDGSTIDGVTVNTAEKAITAFYKFGPMDEDGNTIISGTNSNPKVNVICFNGDPATFTFSNKQYGGRIISSIDNHGTLDMTPANGKIKSDGTENQYLAFGNAYYGPGDYALKVRKDAGDNLLKLTVTSNYYFSNSKMLNKMSNSASNPTVGTFELRNDSADTNGIFKYAVKTGSSGATSIGTGGKFYFVYTVETKGMDTQTTPVAALVPGTDYNDGTALT